MTVSTVIKHQFATLQQHVHDSYTTHPLLTNEAAHYPNVSFLVALFHV